jgi:signal transduction histidine kinase
MKKEVLGPINDEQRQAFDRITLACMFISRLIDDLLDTAAAAAQTLTLQQQEFDPVDIARTVVELCRPQAMAQGLTLHFRSVGAPPPITGDPERVRQVLFNLMSNALRYTKQGSIELVVEVQDATVEFRIEDTGPGIPDALQEDIWRLNTRAIAEGPGYGLGLYVVRLLVEAMGGSVGLRSAVGTGSAFWVRLPAHAGATGRPHELTAQVGADRSA